MKIILVIFSLVLVGCLDKTDGNTSQKSEKKLKEYQNKVRRAEARMLAVTAYTMITMDQVDTGKYDVKSLEKIEKEPNSNYEVLKPDSEISKKYCPDCQVTESKFKVLIAGNIDQDEALDLWTIDQEHQVNHL